MDTKQRHAKNAHLFASIENIPAELADVDDRLQFTTGYAHTLLLNYRECVEYEATLRAQAD